MTAFIPARFARAAHDWFRCSSCGYEVQMKVLGNYATCSQCGGRMART